MWPRALATLTALVVLSASPLWAPNCRKGKPCGKSCIPMSSTCHIDGGSSYSPPAYSAPPEPSSGFSPLHTAPRGGCPLSDDQLMLAVQRLLSARGEFHGAPSALATAPATKAIADFQSKHGMTADGKPSAALLLELTNQAMTGSR